MYDLCKFPPCDFLFYLLQEYTSYVFYLKACTKVGCTQGPSATLSTAQLRPKFVGAPILTALGIYFWNIFVLL
jgi:hypothetical protein